MEKILNIYLYKNEDSDKIIYHDLDSFLDAVEVYKANYKVDLVLDTTCLAALDFKYLDIFTEIVIYGRYKYGRFKISNLEEKIDGENKSKTFIDYHVYDYNDKEILGDNDKELRVAHNLYNLVTKGYFDFNEN